MGLFSSLFKGKKYEKEFLAELASKEETITQGEPLQTTRAIEDHFPEDEIVPFNGDVLDANSYENELILKHNLEVLIKRAKKNNSIDKFYIIREDDIFPDDWKWLPGSDSTTLEYETINLSYMLRKRLSESKLPANKIGDITLPHTRDEVDVELSKIDKTIGNVYMPSYFRSTKHFTINTPLGVTGDYNAVKLDRNFIVLDTMDNFLNSGYAYSVGYRDAYLDVTHEPLEISEDAVILIEKDKYDNLIKDEKLAEQLKKRRVIKYTGDEVLAIDMVLTSLSVLPSKIGMKYATYDDEIHEIIDSSIRKLAEKNNLLLNKSHAGTVSPEGGHFSNYFDEKNHDRNKYFADLAAFIRSKCPGVDFEFSHMYRVDEHNINNLIDTVGPEKLLSIIEEYNEKVKKEFEVRRDAYLEDRKQVTEEIHDLFISTIGLIDEYYMGTARISENSVLESNIQTFIQSKTVEEQVNAARVVQGLLNRNVSIEEEPQDLNKLL